MQFVSCLESLPQPENTWSRALLSTIPSSTVPLAFLYGQGPWSSLLYLCGLVPVVSGLSGPGPEEEPRGADLAQELSHPFSLAFALRLCCHAPSVPPERGRQPKSGQRQLITLVDRARVSVLVGAGNYPAGLGAGRAGTGQRKELPRYARAWPPIGPQGQSWDDRIFLPCWPRRMGK